MIAALHGLGCQAVRVGCKSLDEWLAAAGYAAGWLELGGRLNF